jgi:hypothetical protein
MWMWAPQPPSRGLSDGLVVSSRGCRRCGDDQPGDDAVMPPPSE